MKKFSNLNISFKSRIMKSSTKFWLAIFTFLPLVLLLVCFGFIITIFLDNIEELQHNHNQFPLEFLHSIFWFIFLIILMAIASLGVKIYYIVHVNNTEGNDTNKKVIWTLILIFLGSIASVVYYFIEITPIKSIDKH